MGMVATLAAKVFTKIFKNIGKELDAKPEEIQLGIYYKNGEHKYEAYKNGELAKEELSIDEYVGTIVDFSGGTAVIDATIAQAGPAFAKQYECSVEDIRIVMRQNEKSDFPDAALLVGGIKKRKIDIENEFLKG